MGYEESRGFSSSTFFFAIVSALLTASGWASITTDLSDWSTPLGTYLTIYQDGAAVTTSRIASLLQADPPQWLPHAIVLWAGFGMGLSVIVLGAFAYRTEDGTTHAGPMVWLLASLIAPIAFVIIALATVKQAYTRAAMALAMAAAIAVGPFGLVMAINAQMS